MDALDGNAIAGVIVNIRGTERLDMSHIEMVSGT
jgi:hypothetical protein